MFEGSLEGYLTITKATDEHQPIVIFVGGRGMPRPYMKRKLRDD